jgi:capsular exopolysaccharide synthesis family protein
VELRDYLRIARRNWILLVTLMLVGAGGGTAVAVLLPPTYQSTAESYVSIGAASNVNDLSQGSYFTQQVVASYAHIAVTPYVLGPVIDELSVGTTPAKLAKRVTVEAAAGTSVLDITVADPSPTRAAAIANAVAGRLSSAVRALSPASATASRLVKVTQVQTAVAPPAPSSPSLPLDLGLGLLAGLLLGAVTAAVREALDTRLRDTDQLQRVAAAPLLGEILEDRGARRRPLVVRAEPMSPEAEAYRTLRTNLDFLDLDPGPRAFVVTSAMPGEGKTLSTTNLALTLAESGQRVVLVDADLRRPRVADVFGLDGGLGLTDVIVGRASLGEALQADGPSGLHILPSGSLPPNPGELLGGRRFLALLEELKAAYDVVLFDAPPVLAVADASVLAKRTSGAIVVGAMRSTRRPQLLKALEALDQVDARVFGLIATSVRRRNNAAYGYTQQASKRAQQPGGALPAEASPAVIGR